MFQTLITYRPHDASHNGKALIPIAVSGEAVPAVASSVRLHLGKLLSVERHNGKCLLPINEKPIAAPRTIRRLRGRGGCFLCRRNPFKTGSKTGLPSTQPPCSRPPWPGSISSTFSLSSLLRHPSSTGDSSVERELAPSRFRRGRRVCQSSGMYWTSLEVSRYGKGP